MCTSNEAKLRDSEEREECVRNIITSPQVMTKTKERASDGEKTLACVSVCDRVLCLEHYIQTYILECNIASVDFWKRLIGNVLDV